MKEEVIIMNDKIYICGICGKKYHTVAERNQCERDCIANAEKAAEEKRKKDLEKAKDLRQKAIQKHIDEAAALSESYFNDYGEMPTIKYSVKGNYKKEAKDDSLLTYKDYADILKLFRLW
jgi:hypothetical protein